MLRAMGNSAHAVRAISHLTVSVDHDVIGGLPPGRHGASDTRTKEQAYAIRLSDLF